MSELKRNILGYITLRGSDIESVYQVLRTQGQKSIEELKNLFGIFSLDTSDEQLGQLNDCISFLTNVAIVKTDTSNELVSLASNFGETPFKLLLLNRMKTEKNNPFILVHSLLVTYDETRCHLNNVKTSVEKKFDLGFTWTDEKLDFWLDLANYIGLVKKLTGSREFLFYPHPNLVYDIFLNFLTGKKTEFNLKKIFDQCSTDFFDCFTQEGLLFKGLQQSLLILNNRNLITLQPAASDESNPVKIDGKPYGFVSIKKGE
jgi:hypothetical protein